MSPETHNPDAVSPRDARFQCPRCFREVRPGSVSCPKCGLIFALWENGVARVRRKHRAEPEDPRAEGLWRKVEERPEDESRHEAFLAYCRETHCLDFAARRYQTFLLENPGSSTGLLFRDRILLLAQFEPKAKPLPKVRGPRAHWFKWILGLGAAALLLGLFLARMVVVQ